MLSSSEAYVGIDAGTSACKAVIVDATGRVLARSQAGYPVRRGGDGSVTGDALDWFEALCRTCRACVEALSRATRVAGVAVTAPAHGAVLLDEQFEPLAPVILGSDRRPARVAEELNQSLGSSLYEATWCTPGAGWTLPQLAWQARFGEVEWKRIRHVLIAKDYLRYRLTNSLATDPSDAAGTALFDQRKAIWIPELLAEANVREDQLPPILAPTQYAGSLTAEGASATGLPAGIPVATGATDTIAELCGLGALEPGAGLVKIASTGTVVSVTGEPKPDPRWLTYPHALPDRWASFTVHNTAGVSRLWIEEQLGGSRLELEEAAAEVAAGADGLMFLPFLEGERTPYWSALIRGSFIGLTAMHGRGHLLRAVLEGVAFSLRMGRDVLRNSGMALPEEPYLSGGGMESALWREIVVAVLASSGRYLAGNGPAVGSALIARAMVSQDPISRPEMAGEQIVPNANSLIDYRDRYPVYARLADLLAQLATK